VGKYQFDDKARKWWVDWYNAYEQLDPRRICKDPAFDGWYSRKSDFVIKIAMSLTASRTDDLVLTKEVLVRALTLLERTESTMSKVFRAVGRSSNAIDVDALSQLVAQHGPITATKLQSIVWRDMDARKFGEVLQTAVNAGKIKRVIKRDNSDSILTKGEDI
jgi:hypothetical protein